MKEEVNTNLSEPSSSPTNSTSSPSKTVVHYQDDNAELSHVCTIEESKQSTIFINDGMYINNDSIFDAIAIAHEEKLQN